MKTEYTVEELQKFLIKFIEEYRKKIEEENLEINNLMDLEDPTQIHVIWFHPYDTQYFFITHFDSLPDKEIVVVRTSYGEAIDKLNDWTEEEYWENTTPKEKYYNLELTDKERVQSWAKRLYKEQSQRIFLQLCNENKEKNTLNLTNQIMFLNGAMWDLRGKLLLDLELILEKSLDELRRSQINQKVTTKGKIKEKTSKEKKVTEDKAYGTYMYPHIWLDDYPFETLKDKISGISFIKDITFAELKLHADFWDNKLMFSKDGYIYVLNDNREESLQLLNGLMGILAIMGWPAESVRIQELGEGKINKQTLKIKSWNSRGSARRGAFIERIKLYEDDFRWKIQTIKPEEFLSAIEDADKYPQQMSRFFELYVEVKTQFTAESYSAGFLIGWALIEGLINLVWHRYLEKKGKNKIDDNTLKKMKNDSTWTIYVKCRHMLLNEIFNAELVNRIDKLRARRNDLTHKVVKERIEITKEESEETDAVCKILFEINLDPNIETSEI